MEGYGHDVCMAALGKIFCYKPALGAAMLEKTGDPAVLFTLDPDGLRELFGPFSPYSGQFGAEVLDSTAMELEKLKGYGAYFLPCDSPDYPALLKECPDYPLGLYLRSESPPGEIFSHGKWVAMVGTRDLSPYGRGWCTRLTSALASSPERPAVVSGLALGIDGIAHETALDGGLPTVAVMATGIDSIYPWQHRALAERIASSPGSALITAYPAGTSPVASQFLSRNRIIAGLSEATVLIESRIKGGGMITARFAADYGREVFALPGRVDDIRSQGCNLLIRDCLAAAVTDGRDLLRKLGLSLRTPLRKPGFGEYISSRMAPSLPESDIPKAIRVADAIRQEAGISLGDISAATGLPFPEVSSLVAAMECEGIISTDILQRCTINAKIV